MRVPLLDLSEQYRQLASPIRDRIEGVLASQRFILGPNVEAFEKAMCHYTGAAHAVGVSSGTDALLAAFMAMEIGPGDAVITTAFSFFATAGCIARLGATPVFVDIDPVTYNISTPALEKFLAEECETVGEDVVCPSLVKGKLAASATSADKEARLRIRAIVPVHLFGLCCDMNAIHRLSEKYKIDVVEDAAQAIGAEYPFHSGTKQAGTMAEVGCFSFYPSKNLGAAGDAGLIVCREEAFDRKLRSFRQHGMEPRYFHHVIGGNFRLDEIQAAVLDVKLPCLERMVGRPHARRGFLPGGIHPSWTNEHHCVTGRALPPQWPN